MDQEKCYHVDVFDPSTIDVNRPATTVDEYLKQVVVNRMNCTEVAYAKMDSSKIKPSIAQAAPIVNDKCPYAPNRKWQDEFIIRFGHDREWVEQQRQKIKPLKTKNLLPQIGDGQGWINICLRQRSQHVPIEPIHESKYAAHKGTPPTLRLVLSFSDVLVDKLLSHLFNAFKENGYSRALFEWLYALLLVEKIPVQHDTMAILRSFTKLCRQKRAELGEADIELIREYTIFIAIVSLFFSQKDLADYTVAMSDDDYESVSVHRRAVSSGETSLAGSGDEEKALSDTEISKVQKTKELASQLKGPSSNELETECEKARIQAAKDELLAEKKSDEYVSVDNEGFEDILGGGDLWKKTIKEGNGERGAASQWAEIRVKNLNDPDEEITEVMFPLGYHYILDAWELAVQLMLPGEICVIKSTPRFINGGSAKELLHKYEIELIKLGKFVDFDEMTEEQIIEFLKILNKRADHYFTREMMEHAVQLNIKALDIITRELEVTRELEDDEAFHGAKLTLLISAAHYYWKLHDAAEGMRVIHDGLAIAPANEKLLYKQSQFHFMKKEYKECAAILKKLIAMGIESEAIAEELRKTEIGVKEQLEKEKQVYKRMLGALGKPPRKEQQLKNTNGFNPTKRYLYMAGAVCLLAILFQVIRYFLNIHYF